MEYEEVVGTQPTKGLPILHQEEFIRDDFGMNSFIKEFISFLFFFKEKTTHRARWFHRGHCLKTFGAEVDSENAGQNVLPHKSKNE